MTSLWIFLALLIAVAMLFVLVPLLRYRNVAALSTLEQRREKNREVFTQRQHELENDLQQAVITADEHAILLAELQRAFMLDMDALEKQQVTRGTWTGGKPVILVLAILIPVVSLLLYRSWGSGQDLALPQLLTQISAAQNEEEQSALLNELAVTLQGRFERRQSDLQNGYMLGTLYLELERFPEAVAVFEKMLTEMEPTPDKATVLGQLAQAQYMRAESQLTAEVQATIDEALGLNPNEYAVMSILAIDAFLREDIPGALSYWRRQLSDATPGSQQAEMLSQRIATVESYLPQEERAAVAGATITLVVDIAPELAAQVKEGMSLFVYARNPDSRMPILAQRMAVPEFPFTITLDNSMSMTGITLETSPTLVAGARISLTGVANELPGDFQTLSQPFLLSEQTTPVELLIDQIAP